MAIGAYSINDYSWLFSNGYFINGYCGYFINGY
jgi:hypothetical protein